MIFGTGIDIIDVARIGRVHTRWGDKFLNLSLIHISEPTRP